MGARIPAGSGLFALNWEISVRPRTRGGVGRTRTSNQAVIVKRWAKHSATILPTSTTASRKRRSPQYLSGKLSGRCLGDQLSIGRSGRICDCLFETLKSLGFSYAAFDFVYLPCVLVSRRLHPRASQPISPRPPRYLHAGSVSSTAFASFRSRVSNPSVNQP
jgi:hypothetical protein